MSGIYIHIPFCRHACSYCNFHFSTKQDTLPAMNEAIQNEIANRKDYLEDLQIESIYFGGGTPSLLSPNHIEAFLDIIDRHFSVISKPEITLEANPDDLNFEYLKAIKATGINRLSIGIQSLFDEDLQYLGRVHNAKQAQEAIPLAHQAGFQNLTIDLIYGIPTLSSTNFEQNLQWIRDYSIPHFSAYALTIEPKTALENHIAKGKLGEPPESKYEEHFNQLSNFCEKYRYEQYEISNFARNWNYAIHNSSYWQNKPYLGVGPGAHSFNGISRRWNIANNPKYLKLFNDCQRYYEEETLSITDQFNEYLLTGLRTKWGIKKSYLAANFGPSFLKDFENVLQNHPFKSYLIDRDDTVFIDKAGKLFADAIIAEFFQVND